MTSTAATPARVTVDVRLDPHWRDRAIREDVRRGLSSDPKVLPPKWFYDDVGSELFDQITRLAEYYPTRAEREILRREAAAIAELSRADTFIELGSGTSDKTRTVLDALTASGQLQTFIPFDVSEATLRHAAHAIADEYDGLDVHAVVGDFEHHLADIPQAGHRLLALFGGTIGNFEPAPRAAFLADIAEQLRTGEAFLLGTDLVKSHDRLVRAYDDADGVTAAFNKNVLAVINRELGGDFDLASFEHVARFDEANAWIEMRLRSTCEQEVSLVDLDTKVRFRAGEELLTEISAKFTPDGVATELTEAGFEVARCWTDRAGDYALTLAFRN